MPSAEHQTLPGLYVYIYIVRRYLDGDYSCFIQCSFLFPQCFQFQSISWLIYFSDIIIQCFISCMRYSLRMRGQYLNGGHVLPGCTQRLSSRL